MEKEKSVGKHFIRVKLIFFFLKNGATATVVKVLGKRLEKRKKLINLLEKK